MNVDPVEMPDFGLTQVRDPRQGAGRTQKAVDIYTQEQATIKTIPFSGVADKTVLKVLVENVVATAVSTSPASYDIVYNYSPPELLHGAASGATKTYTVAVINPEGSTTMVFPGCTCTELTISGDLSDESGRIKYSGVWTTRYNVSFGQASPTKTAYPVTFYHLWDMDTTKTVAGIATSILNSFSCTINNPSDYVGFGALGIPEAINRAVPKIEVLYNASIKVDANTAGIEDTWTDGTNGALELSDHATWASATVLGFKAATSDIVSVGFNAISSMYYDVEAECTADTSGDVIQIIC